MVRTGESKTLRPKKKGDSKASTQTSNLPDGSFSYCSFSSFDSISIALFYETREVTSHQTTTERSKQERCHSTLPCCHCWSFCHPTGTQNQFNSHFVFLQTQKQQWDLPALRTNDNQRYLWICSSVVLVQLQWLRCRRGEGTFYCHRPPLSMVLNKQLQGIIILIIIIVLPLCHDDDDNNNNLWRLS